MNKRSKSIFEILNCNSALVIEKLVSELTDEERNIFYEKYLSNLINYDNPNILSKESNKKLHNIIIPKLKRKVLREKNNPTIYTDLLVNLLNDKYSSEELCNILDIDMKILQNELKKLKEINYLFSKQFYSNGKIKYQRIKNITRYFDNENSKQKLNLITDKNEKDLKLLVISDLHFGNTLERIDLVDRAFNYAKKEGINVILCGGDFIDGSFTKGSQHINDLDSQIEYFIQKYPYDKDIITLGVAGNHDFCVVSKESKDFIKIVEEARSDIIIGGYNNAKYNIKNDKIHLYHHINGGNLVRFNAPIIFHGHLHKYITKQEKNTLDITIPSLSDINSSLPSALEVNLSFKKGYIEETQIKQIFFGTKDIILNEELFSFNIINKIQNDKINNEEDFTLKRIK